MGSSHQFVIVGAGVGCYCLFCSEYNLLIELMESFGIFTGYRERIDYKFFLAGHSFGAVDRSGGRTENVVLNKAEKNRNTQILH